VVLEVPLNEPPSQLPSSKEEFFGGCLNDRRHPNRASIVSA
jgi:hypothetical protein